MPELQRIRYLNKYGDPCDVVGRLYDDYLTLYHGSNTHIPYQKILSADAINS